jgi:hypothetical protein
MFGGLLRSEHLVADKPLAVALNQDENLADPICSDGDGAGCALRHDFPSILGFLIRSSQISRRGVPRRSSVVFYHLRPNTAFSTHVADAISEFTQWSALQDPTPTPDKSLEMVGKEAYILAAELVKKDMGYREDESTGNYEWVVGVFGSPAGWEVKEAPDISIYNWDTGVAVQKYEVMEETARTADSIRYAWKWNPRNIPCGVYVGVTNFRIGGKPVIGNIVEKRVRVFLKRENGKLIKAHETIPWD